MHPISTIDEFGLGRFSPLSLFLAQVSQLVSDSASYDYLLFFLLLRTIMVISGRRLAIRAAETDANEGFFSLLFN